MARIIAIILCITLIVGAGVVIVGETYLGWDLFGENEQPGEGNTPGGENPGDDKPGDDKPGEGDTPGDDKPGEEEPPHTHSYTAVIEKEASCSEEGVKKYTCSCGDSYTEAIAKTAHTVVFDDEVKPTCTEEGKTEGQHCDVCNEILIAQQTVPANGHTSAAEPTIENIQDSTCSEEGSYDEVVYCSVCKTHVISRETKTIEKKAHTYDDTNGYATECSVCHTARPACQHPETEVVPGRDATCTAEGLTEGEKCKVCGEITVSQQPIEKESHNYSTVWSKDDNQHWHECSCGDKSDLADHLYDEETDRTPATCTAEGSYTMVCDCGATKTEKLDKLTHTYDQKNTDDKYLVSAATCEKLATYYFSCKCGEKGSTTFEHGELADHSYTVENTEANGALKSAATCQSAAVYYKSCSVCGALSDTDTFTSGNLLAHDWKLGVCQYGCNTPFDTTIVFEFGENGEGTADSIDSNSSIGASKEYTEGNYTLVIENADKVYDGAIDAQGNSCLKFGTASVVGSMTFTVPENITKVTIYVAGYKAKTSKIVINGGEAITLTTSTNNGEYVAINVDTSVNKTVSFATVSGASRCAIDKIVLSSTIEHEHKGGEANCQQAATCQICGKTYGNLGNHSTVNHDAVAPTCQNGGFTAGVWCTLCETYVSGHEAVGTVGHSYVDGVCKWCQTAEHVCSYTHRSVVTEATCAAQGYTTNYCECGESQVDPQSYNGPVAHKDTDGDFKCDFVISGNKCAEIVHPAANSTLTIEQAIAYSACFENKTFSTDRYYITGKIESISNTTYGNMVITDGNGHSIDIYGLYSENGSVRYDEMTTKPVVGDVITIHAVVGVYNKAQLGSSTEATYNHLTSLNAHNCTPVADATCLAASICSVCGKTLVAQLEHEDTNSDGICDNGCGNPVGGGEDEPTVPTDYAWVLVTDLSQLAAGKEIVIVAANANYAISTTQNNNNRGQAVIEKDGNTVIFGNDTQIILLEVGTVDGTYAFKVGDKYLYAASSSSNYLRSGSKNDNASWLITIADGVTSIVAQGTNARNQLKHNSANSLFSCYASGQNNVCIYVKTAVSGGSGETPDTPVDPNPDTPVDPNPDTPVDPNPDTPAQPAAPSKTTSIAVGDVVYFVCESKGTEMSSFNGTSYAYGQSYDDTVSGLYAWTVVAGATDGTYAFKNSEGNYMCWTSSNSLKTNNELNNNSSWNVTFDKDGNAVVTNSATPTRKVQWNASSPRFAAYESNQTAIQLYK